MPANKTPRSAILQAMSKASEADVIVPNDLYWRPCVPGEATVLRMRGYVSRGCVDEALIREQAEQGRELMKEITWNS